MLSIADGETSAYIADLHPGTTYSGYMLSENGVGTSNQSIDFKFTTREAVPTASPLDVKLVGIGAKFFKIQWKVSLSVLSAEVWASFRHAVVSDTAEIRILVRDKIPRDDANRLSGDAQALHYPSGWQY